LKDKKIIIIAAASAVVVIALLIIFMPSGNKQGEQAPEVISMRARVSEEAPPAATPAATVDGVPAVEGGAPAVVDTPSTPPSVETTAAAPAPTTAPPAPAPVAAPAPVKKSVEQALKAPEPVKETKQVEKKEAPVKKAATEKERKAQKAVKTAKSAEKAVVKPWALNIASFAALPEAQGLAGALKKAGYNSYITDFTKESIKWHRVRVGFFKNREEAEAAARIIKSKFRIDTPWVVKPDRHEMNAHS